MNEPIHSLSYANQMIIVGLEYSVLCCSLFNGLRESILTSKNPEGIHAVSFGQDFCVAVPSKTPGHV